MRFDNLKPMLSPKQLEALPQFRALTDQQKTFLLLLSGGATVVTAMMGAFKCKNLTTAKSFSYELMQRKKTLRPILNKLFGLKSDDEGDFMSRLAKLIRRGSKVTDAEVRALILFGNVKGLVPHDYTVEDLNQ